MAKLDRIRELAGVEPTDEPKKKIILKEEVSIHTIKEGGSHLFFLVTGATKESMLAEVITEVDTVALVQIGIGTGLKTVKEEKWELFPHSMRKEAILLAQKRLLAARQSASEEEEEVTTKNVSNKVLTAVEHIIKHLDGEADKHHKSRDRDLLALYSKDASAYQTILQQLKQNHITSAAETYRHMDTAARDHTSDPKLVITYTPPKPSFQLNNLRPRIFGPGLAR